MFKRNLAIIYAVLILAIVVVFLFFISYDDIEKKTNYGVDDDEDIILSLWYLDVLEASNEVDSILFSINNWNEKKYKIKIKEERINIEQYKTKIKTSLAVGEAPDIFFMWEGSFVYPYIKSKNILSLDSYLKDGTKERINPSALRACTYDGEIYGLPTFTFIANLYCNMELFERVGAKIPETFEELVNAVKLLRKNNITPIGLGEKDFWPGMYWYDILALRQAGSEKCLKALEDPEMFNDKDFKIASDKLVKLIKLKAFDSNSFGISYEEMVDNFINGKTAMIFQGNWIEASIESRGSRVKGKVSVVPFPLIEGGKGTLDEFFGGNVDGFYVNMNTKYKNEAVNVLKFICENTGKTGYLRSNGLSAWKMDNIEPSKLESITQDSTKLLSTLKSNVKWWDTILDAQDADLHKTLVAKLLAEQITSEEFIKETSKLRGVSK